MSTVYSDSSGVFVSVGGGGVFRNVVYIRYLDHVMYSRVDPLIMSPQTRETMGWLVYECEQYVTIKHDQDASTPPTLKGGDQKASGLCLLKTNILEIQHLNTPQTRTLPKIEHVLNNKETVMPSDEYALSATKVKNSQNKNKNNKNKNNRRGKIRCYSHDS